MQKYKAQKDKVTFDKKFLVLTLLLTLVGLIALTDASAPLAQRSFSDKFFFIKQQLVWAFFGVVSLFVISKVNYKFWEKIASLLFFASLFTLLLVFVPNIGAKFLGARRWVILGPLTFQPSEFIKLTLAVYIAKLATRDKKLFAYLLPIILSSFLIMLQPDLGTTIVVVGMAMVQIFVSGIPLAFFALTLAGGLILGIVLIIFSDYRRERLLTFFYETRDPLDKSYHIRQILLALGSGGLFGVGLGHSRQKYLFLPETATDSIFAVISEEVGFLGAALLILVFIYFIIRGLKIARRAPDRFSQILAIGIVSWIGGQTFLNISSMLALVPLTGIPLPFFSYGGSSLVTILIACGILLNISRYGKEK